MEYILAQGVQAHLPPSQCQGFFSGLTKLSEDELKNGKGTMRIKDTGSLKVRTPHSRARAHADNSGALAMPGCRGRTWRDGQAARVVCVRGCLRVTRWCERTTGSSRSLSSLRATSEGAAGAATSEALRWSAQKADVCAARG